MEAYNLKEIRQLYNLTQQELAQSLGITREMVNKMEKGKRSVSKATRALLERFLQEREGERFSQDSVGDVQFWGVPKTGPAIPYQQQRRWQKNHAAPLEVPLIEQKAQAGYVKSYDQVDYLDTLEKYALPPGVNPTGAIWSYFEVDGDSMEPTLCAQDLVLASMVPAEDWPDVKNFGVYIVLVNNQLLIKRIYQKSKSQWVLLSDNQEAYPQMPIQVREVRQLWQFRRHISAQLATPQDFKIG